MRTRTACRRRHSRHVFVHDPDARVEFEYPKPNGRRYSLPLVDVSPSGLSFSGELEEMPQLDAGANVADVQIRIGDCEIRGELVVMHVTRQPHSNPVCGALLYPGSDDDLVKLKAVIAGMEAVQRG